MRHEVSPNATAPRPGPSDSADGHSRRAGTRVVAWTSDAYLDAHRAEWTRLDALVKSRRLTGAESDELLNLYQRAATHLSVIRSTSPDARTVEYLSTLVARPVSGPPVPPFTWAAVATYLTRTLPPVSTGCDGGGCRSWSARSRR